MSDPKGNAAASADAATALQRLTELTASLAGAPGAKALLRLFGELMADSFGVKHMDFARFASAPAGAAPNTVTLKRRAISVQGVDGFATAEWDALAVALTTAGLTPDALKEGIVHFAVGGRSLALAAVEDPHAVDGCIVAWEPVAATTDGLGALMADQIVRTLQSESRWFKKLDKTQALLYQDDLTGLYNTRYFEIALDAELRRADRFQNQFCLLFIDLDGFKPINDQHGHMSGSSVLRQVAEVIREAVREVDVPIRYGGDEFVIVLLGATCSKGVLAAERVRRRIEHKEFRLEDGCIARITCSIGVAAYPEHGKDKETLLKMADETMYDSKRAGKNRVTVVTTVASQTPDTIRR